MISRNAMSNVYQDSFFDIFLNRLKQQGVKITAMRWNTVRAEEYKKAAGEWNPAQGSVE